MYLYIVDDNIDRKRTMRMNVNQGVIAAENLKKRIKETAINSSLTPPLSTTTTSLSTSPTMIPHDDCKYSLLISIEKKTYISFYSIFS